MHTLNLRLSASLFVLLVGALLVGAMALSSPAGGLRKRPVTTKPQPEQQSQLTQLAQASPAFQLAIEKLDEIERADQQPTNAQGLPHLSRQQLIARNLSRFFVRTTVPDNNSELQRLLGAAQRITREAGRIFLGAALSVAREDGATIIGDRHLRRVTEALLPYQLTPTGDRLYFSNAGSDAILIERWDLEALERTGMAWEVLGGLADSAIAPSLANNTGLDIERPAALLLADTLNAYGLLVFRLGGEVARSGFEPAVATRHLREAVKILRSRADGKPAPILQPYQPARGANTQSGEPLFTDVTATMGITFQHTSSDWIGRLRRFGPVAPTFSGGGAAAGDVDRDGWTDLVVCGGQGCALLLNREGRTYEDATASAGVGHDAESRMPILADFDNDGDLDLFVTVARDPNRLFLNDGKGHFTIASNTGLETERDISGPASAVDVDNDGLLDLYVGNFGNYLQGASAWAAREAVNGMPNRLYRNLGARDGVPRFQDITATAGVGDTGWAQALSHLDIDRDGDQDLYIANDFGRNQLYLNRGDSTFEAAGASSGSDDAFHGMNVSFADINRDGLGDIFITNIWFWATTTKSVAEANTLLLSAPATASTEARSPVRFTRSSAEFLKAHDSGWAWAGVFFDLENDGDDDLLVANGFTDYMTFAQYRPHPSEPDQLFAINNGREANLLFLNTDDVDDGLPSTLRTNSGLELADVNTRTAITLDFDNDGDLDLFLTTFHGRARLLRNDAPRSGGHLRLELIGDPQRNTNRDAIGAQLTLVLPAGRKVWRTVTGGEGYLGMNDLPVEFGTGGTVPLRLEVLWPNGDTETITGLPAEGRLLVRQGTGKAELLAPTPQ